MMENGFKTNRNHQNPSYKVDGYDKLKAGIIETRGSERRNNEFFNRIQQILPDGPLKSNFPE